MGIHFYSYKNPYSMHWNYDYEIEVEIDEPDVEYEIEYDAGYQPMNQQWNYGGGHNYQGGHGNFNHFGSDVEIEVEIEQPNWGGWQQWGASRNHNWEVPWTVWYKQNGMKNNMNFRNFQVDHHGNIWGHGSDANGNFNISGKVNWSNTGFKFHKQYVGQHAVVYSGRIQNDIWAGNWCIPGQPQERFQLRCQSPRWVGAFWQNGQPNNMQLDMHVGPQGVFGRGHDNVGSFVIRGETHGNQVNFAKQYIGAHTVLYSGRCTGWNNIQGTWQIPGNA